MLCYWLQLKRHGTLAFTLLSGFYIVNNSFIIADRVYLLMQYQFRKKLSRSVEITRDPFSRLREAKTKSLIEASRHPLIADFDREITWEMLNYMSHLQVVYVVVVAIAWRSAARTRSVCIGRNRIQSQHCLTKYFILSKAVGFNRGQQGKSGTNSFRCRIYFLLLRTVTRRHVKRRATIFHVSYFTKSCLFARARGRGANDVTLIINAFLIN
jgi:hypothetical protein